MSVFIRSLLYNFWGLTSALAYALLIMLAFWAPDSSGWVKHVSAAPF